MKYKRPLRAFLILLLTVSPVNKVFPVKDGVRLRIISISWSTKEWQDRIVDTTYIEVIEGENFGGKNSPHYFKLLEVVDSHNIKIGFTDDVVVAGEPIAYPSKQNPVVLTEETICFRTRIYDAGSDYCITLIY